jgi:protein TonB
MFDLQRIEAPAWFTIDEVAQVAGMPADQAWRLAGLGQAVVHANGHFVSAADAVNLVLILRGDRPESADRAIFNQIPRPAGKTKRGLAIAGVLHGIAALFLVLGSWIGFVDATASEDIPKPKEQDVKLVYLMMPGPGGGGGGGGLREPEPPPPARKKAVMTFARKTPSPVPPARPRPAPPPPRPVPPRPEARVEPSLIDKPVVPVPQAIQAPVKTIAADPFDAVGLPVDAAPTAPSRGPGTGGGVGSGSGSGLGEGNGGGIGPGSGGGTGGGPFQPGAGIDPPTLVREIRPSYTDAARRQAIEGDVVLEIVVRNDGSVGNVRVRRTLGAGLEQKAIEAVRQWRFIPAKRRGAPVDVVVDVAVEFKLR